MKIWKPESIVWTELDTPMPVSEPLVMASAAGWYVGEICKESYGEGWYMAPYARITGYYETPEEADVVLREMSNG